MIVQEEQKQVSKTNKQTQKHIPESDEETPEEEQSISKRLSEYVPRKKSDHNNDKFQECIQNLQVEENIKDKLTKITTAYDSLMSQCHDLILIFDTIEKYLQKIVYMQKIIGLARLQIQIKFEAIKLQELRISLDKYSLLENSQDRINLPIVSNILDVLYNTLLIELERNNQDFFALKRKRKSIIDSARIILSKILTVIEIFPFAVIMNQTDIKCLPQDSPEWLEILQHTKIKKLDERQNIIKSYNKVLKGILVGNAIVSKQSEYDSSIMKGMVMTFGGLYYLVREKSANKRAACFQAEPQADQALRVWNMLDHGMIKHMLGAIFPSIKYKENIFTPRYFKPINLQYILNQYQNGTINKKLMFGNQYVDNGIELISSKELFDKDLLKQGNVQIRILCGKKILLNKVQNPQQQVQSPIEENKDRFSQMFEEIVIHIQIQDGGGFVSMSSRSHQTYTRKWATNLGVPIFSIDYRLSPHSPFPSALDDVWQAYNWIINFAPIYFNILPKRVILVGDSAGGNLIAALTLLTIKEGVRAPDGLLMAYPALNLTMTDFTPSMLISLNDGLLPHTFLKLCLNSYIKDTELKPLEDPLISPLKASDELLSEFPPSYIMTGDNDPLHDDSLRMAQKLIQLKREFQLILYEGMPHGFLSFDLPSGGMKESEEAVKDAEDLLRNLLKIQKLQ